MTTRQEFLGELIQFLEDKKQEFEYEVDEEFMQWSEDYDNPQGEFYEVCQEHGNKILHNKGEIDTLMEELENFLINK